MDNHKHMEFEPCAWCNSASNTHDVFIVSSTTQNALLQSSDGYSIKAENYVLVGRITTAQIILIVAQIG